MIVSTKSVKKETKLLYWNYWIISSTI